MDWIKGLAAVKEGFRLSIHQVNRDISSTLIEGQRASHEKRTATPVWMQNVFWLRGSRCQRRTDSACVAWHLLHTLSHRLDEMEWFSSNPPPPPYSALIESSPYSHSRSLPLPPPPASRMCRGSSFILTFYTPRLPLVKLTPKLRVQRIFTGNWKEFGLC